MSLEEGIKGSLLPKADSLKNADVFFIIQDGSTKTVPAQTLSDFLKGSSVSNEAYSLSWSGDISTSPSRNALYNIIEQLPRLDGGKKYTGNLDLDSHTLNNVVSVIGPGVGSYILFASDGGATINAPNNLSIIGNVDFGGYNIQNVNLLKVLNGGGIYNTANNANIILSSLGSIDLTGTGFTYNGVNVELLSNKGVASGYAGLDASGKVPYSQLPAGLVGAMQYQGVWNANTNTPALASGVGTTGFFYKVSVSGNTVIDGNTNWHVGDWIVFDGTTWEKVDNYEAVTTVFGRVGDITLLASDVTGALTYTPVNKSGDTMTGALKLPAGTAINPSLLFSGSSTNTGIYTSGVDQISILIIGTNRVIISNTGMTISGGLAVTTGISITGNLQFKGGSRAITDDNGNTLIGFPPTVASAVNYFQISNSSSGSNVSLSAVGSDTNISINLTPKGSGSVAISGILSVTSPGASILLFSGNNVSGNVTSKISNLASSAIGNRAQNLFAVYNSASTLIDAADVRGGLSTITSGSEVGILELRTYSNGSLNTKLSLDNLRGIFSVGPQLPSYSKTSLPITSFSGQLIYVTDDVSGACCAYCDGTHWKRIDTNAIIS